MLANFTRAEFSRIVSGFRKRKIKSLSRVHVLHQKRKIRTFHGVVVQRRQRNVRRKEKRESVMRVKKCCFANLFFFFFAVLVAVAVIVAKAFFSLKIFIFQL